LIDNPIILSVMLDYVSIFSDTGLVLWSKTFCKVDGTPVDNFIDNVLMEEKGGEKSTIIDKYSVKWSFVNGAGFELVFVAIYSKLLTLLYIEDLLEAMKAAFVGKFESRLPKMNGEMTFAFDSEFNRLLDSAETKSMQQKKLKNSAKIAQRSPVGTAQKAATESASVTPSSKGGGEDGDGDGDGEGLDVAAARAR
jgi:signal recognition particle receptor subunit alpha